MISQSEICCIIITYNPDAGLSHLVQTMIKQVEHLIIVDNNSQDGVGFIEAFSHNDKVRVIWNEENFGIAKALNQGATAGIHMGFDWAITFDQDSKPNANIIDIVKEAFSLFPHKEDVGAIGVNYERKGDNEIYNEKSKYVVYQIKDTLITSGCLMSLKVFQEIRGFREDFFIDHVDEEYSLRLKRHGKVSLFTTKPGMVHEVGENRTKKLFGFTLRSSNHSPLRRFYMGRNQIILIKEYAFNYPYFVLKSAVLFTLDIIQMVILDENKRSKLASCFKGIVTGIVYSSKRKRFYD